ncbi:MAG: hypothetical protein HZC13_02365 [Nitrospirae bacterium]|nr:hypothetical protein [Nitrospirota bacterium]MBI5096649.1 hypothetical protein [Nitrospirota bacterium]
MKRILNVMLLLIFIGAIGAVTDSMAQKKGEKTKTTELPVGTPRTAEEFSRDADTLIESRRSTISDGESALLFKPARCLRCHENKPGVEGQIFYGYPDFGKDVNWPGYIAHPERKHAPSLDEYNFYDAHAGKKKRLPITIGQDLEQRLKQMQ